MVKSCWQTQHVFSPLAIVMGKRAMAKIPADLRPAFLKAINDATAQQRTIAEAKVAQSEQQLKQHGVAFYPMAPAERATVRSELQASLYQSFAKQYPATAPLFADIAAARA